MADAVAVSRASMAPYPDRYGMIGSVMTHLRKLAVDGAVNLSVKGVTGGKRVYKVVQERFIDRTSPSLNDNCGQVPKMQVKMEQLQEDMNNIKQRSQASAKTMGGGSEPLKKTPNGGINELDVEKDKKKRIFIRSRL